MLCAWAELLAVLPLWMREEVDMLGSANLEELRMRINAPAELVFLGKSRWLSKCITQDDLNYTVNASSRYSPWSAVSAAKGYITVLGGHRIGICGEAVIQRGMITGIKNITSICIRVARDFPGIAEEMKKVRGSVLILGPPGFGKTTLLRDLIRQKSELEHIGVVDERGELFPEGIPRGKCVDILYGCGKKEGISMLLRTMGPSCIAVDEITDTEDAEALQQAANCGVRLFATAHAASFTDLHRRSIYRMLLEKHVFDVCLFLKRDKSFTMERITEWDSNGSVQY